MRPPPPPLALCPQVSAIDSTSEYVRCSLLRLLTFMAEHSTQSYEVVMNALDHVKLEKEQDLRFNLLVEAFGDLDNVTPEMATHIMVFLNTLLSSAFEFEERVILRSEMVAAGMLDAMHNIR
ncbi:unnamed protein product, partial [Discosporangium mesarthrocarpum]